MPSNKITINDNTELTYEVSDTTCDTILNLCKHPTETAGLTVLLNAVTEELRHHQISRGTIDNFIRGVTKRLRK